MPTALDATGRRCALLACTLLGLVPLAGCSAITGFGDYEFRPAADGAAPDARRPDARPGDGAPTDVGPLDARPLDARPLDAEPADADTDGGREAAAPDSGGLDAGPDAGPPDADGGSADSGPDAIAVDGGPTPCTDGCDDGNDCTRDACEAARCTHEPLGGVRCDDHNACTLDDTCDAGVCVPARVTDLGPTRPCMLTECDPTSGRCQSRAAPLGSSCDDGDPCTNPTSCSAAGVCTGPSACPDDGNPCTAEECDSGGVCASQPLDDVPCPGGTCCGGVCTVTLSDPASCGSCGHACEPTSPACVMGLCVACATAAQCNDGLACTSDVCSDGACGHPLAPGSCLIGGQCYAAGALNPTNDCQTCDPASPYVWKNATVGTSCDDGLFCTATDRCTADGRCQGDGDPCSAMDPCSTWACLESSDSCLQTRSGCAVGVEHCCADGCRGILTPC